MMRYILVLAACLSLAAARSSNNKLLLQRLERILQEERAVEERAGPGMEESAVEEKGLHKDGPERRVAITAAITKAVTDAIGKAFDEMDMKVDVNKALKTLSNAFLKSMNSEYEEALIFNADSKPHSFYAYNTGDFLYWKSASKATAGEGGVAPVNKQIGWGERMQVYVDDKDPQYIVKLGETYVYTAAKGINPIDMSEFKKLTTNPKPDPKPDPKPSTTK